MDRHRNLYAEKIVDKCCCQQNLKPFFTSRNGRDRNHFSRSAEGTLARLRRQKIHFIEQNNVMLLLLLTFSELNNGESFLRMHPEYQQCQSNEQYGIKIH